MYWSLLTVLLELGLKTFYPITDLMFAKSITLQVKASMQAVWAFNLWCRIVSLAILTFRLALCLLPPRVLLLALPINIIFLICLAIFNFVQCIWTLQGMDSWSPLCLKGFVAVAVQLVFIKSNFHTKIYKIIWIEMARSRQKTASEYEVSTTYTQCLHLTRFWITWERENVLNLLYEMGIEKTR